jgi:hypothetical protein
VTPQQQAHALVSYFESSYQAKYRRKPKINRYADKWGFVDMLKDVPYERAKQVIDFYFLTAANHSLSNFFYNYSNLIESLEEKEADVEKRRRLRAESKKRVMEYERRSNERSEVN